MFKVYLDKWRNFKATITQTNDLAFETRGTVNRLTHRMNDQDLLLQDLLIIQLRQSGLSVPFTLKTDHPVAIHSLDHIHPWGTANDATRHPRFVRACEAASGKKELSFMDLGCAGGGLVFDFLLRGHRAIGLEGSDYSLLAQRSFWRLVPNHLHTCDITKPFTVDGNFDVISAWEVLEHIEGKDVPAVLSNIEKHLAPNGYFTASVATYHDVDPKTGVDYHRTVQPKAWWSQRLKEAGLKEVEDHPFAFADYVRGTSNGPMDWDAKRDPHIGFHIVARKA